MKWYQYVQLFLFRILTFFIGNDFAFQAMNSSFGMSVTLEMGEQLSPLWLCKVRRFTFLVAFVQGYTLVKSSRSSALTLRYGKKYFLAHFFANFVFSLRFRTVGAKNKIFFGLTFFDFYLENFLIKFSNVQLPPHGATTKYPNNICWLSLTRTNLSFESNEHYTVFQYLTSYNAHIGGLLCSKQALKLRFKIPKK